MQQGKVYLGSNISLSKKDNGAGVERNAGLWANKMFSTMDFCAMETNKG